MRRIVAQTLVWLREQPHEAGTTFAVVETPDPKAAKPVEVDAGTAALWLRHGKADEAPSPALRAPSPQRGEGKPRSSRKPGAPTGTGLIPGY